MANIKTTTTLPYSDVPSDNTIAPFGISGDSLISEGDDKIRLGWSEFRKETDFLFTNDVLLNTELTQLRNGTQSYSALTINGDTTSTGSATYTGSVSTGNAGIGIGEFTMKQEGDILIFRFNNAIIAKMDNTGRLTAQEVGRRDDPENA